jgi:hypothetical protein
LFSSTSWTFSNISQLLQVMYIWWVSLVMVRKGFNSHRHRHYWNCTVAHRRTKYSGCGHLQKWSLCTLWYFLSSSLSSLLKKPSLRSFLCLYL